MPRGALTGPAVRATRSELIVLRMVKSVASSVIAPLLLVIGAPAATVMVLPRFSMKIEPPGALLMTPLPPVVRAWVARRPE
jgi:hypothetical protein